MKIESSSKEGTFVGYSESSKAYRIYNPGIITQILPPVVKDKPQGNHKTKL